MSIPHDYYGRRPELRSRGNSRCYAEPDYIANDCDDQLPLLSTVGRGPRGAGLKIDNVVNEDDEFRFTIYDDLTGETVLQSPNLSAGVISVSAKPSEPVPGDIVNMDVTVNYASASRHYSVALPSGVPGSRFFVCDRDLEDGGKGHAYQVPVDELMHYGYLSSEWQSMPVPRVNDMVMFSCSGKLGFGTIEAVEDGKAVFTSQVSFDVLQHLAIGENGNWTIDGEDTGVKAQGDPGKNGESAKVKAVRTDDGVKVTATDVDGTTEAVVKDGADGFSPTIVSTDTDTGVRLEITDETGSSTVDIDDGTDGKDGLPANMVVRTVAETKQPSFELQRTDVATNTWSVDIGLPRGADGKSVDIQGGIYRVDQLPSFDDTEVNKAFVVYDDDEDRSYDLYIRGEEPVIASTGGPWTVVEDWQGRPGYSLRYLKQGYDIPSSGYLVIPKEECEQAFSPSFDVMDGDVAVDANGMVGLVSSALDDSGDYRIQRIGQIDTTVDWDHVENVPPDLMRIATNINFGVPAGSGVFAYAPSGHMTNPPIEQTGLGSKTYPMNSTDNATEGLIIYSGVGKTDGDLEDDSSASVYVPYIPMRSDDFQWKSRDDTSDVDEHGWGIALSDEVESGLRLTVSDLRFDGGRFYPAVENFLCLSWGKTKSVPAGYPFVKTTENSWIQDTYAGHVDSRYDGENEETMKLHGFVLAAVGYLENDGKTVAPFLAFDREYFGPRNETNAFGTLGGCPNSTITLSDATIASLNKADTAIQQSDLDALFASDVDFNTYFGISS